MMRTTTAVITILLIATHAGAADQTPAAKQYQALLEEYEQEGGARAFAKRFLDFAAQHPRDPAAADALLWVVKRVRGRSDTDRALELLAKHQLGSEKLAAGCQDIAKSRSGVAEKLLRDALKHSPHRDVRAQACFHLAALLDVEANLVAQLKAEPELAPRVLQYYGKQYGQHLASLKLDQLARQRELLYQQLLKSFADVEIQDSKLGAIAKSMLFQIRHLSIGRVAPEITGEDIHGEEFRLSDYRGKVVMLSFWGHW